MPTNLFLTYCAKVSKRSIVLKFLFLCILQFLSNSGRRQSIAFFIFAVGGNFYLDNLLMGSWLSTDNSAQSEAKMDEKMKIEELEKKMIHSRLVILKLVNVCGHFLSSKT